MANKAQALYQFWSGFGLPAYDTHSVPKDAVMPYITYETAEDMLDNVLSLSASLWYNSTTWADIEAKANVIAYTITNTHTPVPITQGGYMWIKRGSPFMQRMNDPASDTIRRIYINIEAEFLTAY